MKRQNEEAKAGAFAYRASVRNEDRARSQQAGFQAHLAKPVNPNELVTTIIELVGQKARNE
jgi:CheY-like chemotaxis protein